jgi:hypothetical protein
MDFSVFVIGFSVTEFVGERRGGRAGAFQTLKSVVHNLQNCF